MDTVWWVGWGVEVAAVGVEVRMAGGVEVGDMARSNVDERYADLLIYT